MVGEQAELAADRARGVADVDTRQAARTEDPVTLAPDLVEDGVHELECPHSVPVGESGTDQRVQGKKLPVPHLDHRVGRRGHHQVDRAVDQRMHTPRVRKENPMRRVHQDRTRLKVTRTNLLRSSCISSGSVSLNARISRRMISHPRPRCSM